jgi:hypothetical protein
MPAPLTLNEAGFGRFDTKEQAHDSMTAFAEMLADVLSTGCEPSRVYISPAVYQVTIAPELNLSAWLFGEPTWGIAQEHMLSLLDGAKNPADVDFGDVYACSCAGIESAGLLAACAVDGLAVSQLAEEPWDSSRLEVTLASLNGEKTESQVVHCSRSEHRREIHVWLSQRLFDGATATDLWKGRATYFPYLMFSDMALRWMPDVPSGPPGMERIVERLFELNSYAQRRVGDFDQNEVPFDIRGEGGRTMELYGHQRQARCADGIDRVFRFHCDLDDGWRMYFKPDDDSSRIHVGRIGPHPQTAKGYS